MLPTTFADWEAYEAIMEAVQTLKIVHHTDVLDALLSTGDAPLHYMQASKTGEASQGSALDALSARLFSDSGGSSRYGEFGKPLPPKWTSLLHPDDTFWGIDPSSDAEDENSNHLSVSHLLISLHSASTDTIDFQRADYDDIT